MSRVQTLLGPKFTLKYTTLSPTFFKLPEEELLCLPLSVGLSVCGKNLRIEVW